MISYHRFFSMTTAGDLFFFCCAVQYKDVVIISESEYNDLQKAKCNAEYLKTIDRSIEQLQKGETISFSMEELKAMKSDDWRPTQKIKDFMKIRAKEFLIYSSGIRVAEDT